MLRQGDLVAFRTRGLFAALIRVGQWLGRVKHWQYTHIAIVVSEPTHLGDVQLIQAVKKIDEVWLSDYMENDVPFVVLPFPGKDEDRADVVAFAQTMKGMKYGVLTVVFRAINYLTPKWVRITGERKGRMDCSVFGARAFEHGGWIFPRDWDVWQTTPGDLVDMFLEGPSKGGSVTLTRKTYVLACLAKLGSPATQEHIDALQAKIIQEWSADSGQGPTDNALDLTEAEPGVTPFNTFGGGEHVWNYTSLEEGAQAFHDILQAAEYSTVVRLLLSPSSTAEEIIAAWNQTAWGYCNPAFIGQYRSARPLYDSDVVPNVGPLPDPPNPQPAEEDMKAYLATGSAGGLQIIAADCQTKRPVPEGDVAPVLLATGQFIDLRGKLNKAFVDSIPVS